MIRSLSMLIFCSFISISTFALKDQHIDFSWRSNWKMEIKTGVVTALTPAPEKYLHLINNMNIPVGVAGPLGTFSLKKGFTSHFEMGYQLDYLRLQGKAANQDGINLEVLTQMYNQTLQVQYNFKKNNQIKPTFNYFLYLKMGGVLVKNKPVKSGIAPPSTGNHNESYPIAFASGLGAGLNYQLTNNFSLEGSMDINKSADGIGEILQLQKLFYSNNNGNNFLQSSFGLTWWFNLWSKEHRAKDSANFWFDSSRGKM